MSDIISPRCCVDVGLQVISGVRLTLRAEEKNKESGWRKQSVLFAELLWTISHGTVTCRLKRFTLAVVFGSDTLISLGVRWILEKQGRMSYDLFGWKQA